MLKVRVFGTRKWFIEKMLACSRRSYSRVQDKNSQRKKKNEGRLEGERGSPSPRFRVYNLTRSPLTAALYYLNVWNGLRKRSRQHFTIGLALRCGWETSTSCNDMSLRWLDIDMKRNDSITKRMFLVTWWWNCSWISLACSCCRIISSTFLSSEQQRSIWRRLEEYV